MSKAKQENRKQLDHAGRLVLLAAARNDEAVEAAASSPFLYTRMRARISEEERRRQEPLSWGSLLFVARRAIPAMALVAVMAAILTVWSMQPVPSTPGYRLDEEALTDPRDPGVEQTIFARNTLSRDEVFSLVVDRNGR